MKRNIIIHLALFALLCASAWGQSSTTGAIQGQVRDTSGGGSSPLAGVTIIAKSKFGSSTATTDANGKYIITNLKPGEYILTFFFADQRVDEKKVIVNVNKTSSAYSRFDSTKIGETKIITGTTPTIDTKNTAAVTRLDNDYLTNMPVPGRTFEDSLGAAPGTQGDALGVSISGSTSLENTYNVDGVNTTSLTFGTVGSPVINDFIQEIEIITGGYNAEYGRATGGIINVVTKSGTNEFKGSFFGYFTPGILRADQERFPIQASPIDTDVDLIFDGDFGVEVGGPIIKDKLFFYAGFAPDFSRTNVDRIIQRRRDCQNELPDGTLTPCVTTDGNGDGIPDGADGLPDKDPSTGRFIYDDVDQRSITQSSNQYNMVGKLNYQLSPEHQGQLSFVGAPGSSRTNGIYGVEDSVLRESSFFTSNLSFKWTSKFNNNDTELELVTGWLRTTSRSDAVNNARNAEPQQFGIYGDLGTWAGLGGESTTTAMACRDSNNLNEDPYPLITNCPDEGVGYSFGGIGSLIDDKEQRLSGRLGVTHRLRLGKLGTHEFKAGVDMELNNTRTQRVFSGGRVGDNTPAERWVLDLRGQYYVDRWVDLGAAVPAMGNPSLPAGFDRWCRDSGSSNQHPCTYLKGGDPRTIVSGETFNWSAYLRDSWEILPNLTFNAGLRYEEQRLRFADELQGTLDPLTGRQLGTNAMTLTNLWAPRVGVSYDWTEVGRSKVFAHWGRFYQSIPMQINERSFGGETFYREVFNMGDCGGMSDPNIGGPPGPDCPIYDADGRTTNSSQAQLFGSGVLVAPGIKAMFLDEFVAGLEYELLEDLKITARYSNRSLGRILEDVSTDNAATYIIANPGEWSEAEEQKLIDQINATMDPAEKARLENELEQFRGIRTFDKGRRDYNAFELVLQRRFSKKFFMQASYTYSRTIGNFPGLFSADNGQVDPNITSQFDLIELLANREGPLPQDRPHYVKIDSYYVFDFKKAGNLTTGARFRALSGVPVDALGRHYRYGFDEAFILPRGQMGRTNFDWSIDLHVGYKYQLSRGIDLELFIDVFNLANQQGTFSVDETYTFDFANPIVDGEKEDLVFLKQTNDAGGETNIPAGRNRNFLNTAGRYAPLSTRLGLRLTF